MASKTIQELSATAAPLAANDLIVIEKGDGSGTKKMTYTELINAISNDVVRKSALVNNGNQTAEGYALDARYGKTLADSTKKVFGSESIPENANLNSYVTPGEYYTGSNTIAASITNSPVTKAFRLTVELSASPSQTTNIRQTIKEYQKNVTYTRYANSVNSVLIWSEWYTDDGIIPFHLGNAQSTSFTMRNNFVMIVAERDANYQLLALDYWSANSVVIASQGTTLLTVTKAVNSYDVTITNARSSQTVGFIFNPVADLRIQ